MFSPTPLVRAKHLTLRSERATPLHLLRFVRFRKSTIRARVAGTRWSPCRMRAVWVPLRGQETKRSDVWNGRQGDIPDSLFLFPGLAPGQMSQGARSRGLQPAFIFNNVFVFIDPERGLKPATTCSTEQAFKVGEK